MTNIWTLDWRVAFSRAHILVMEKPLTEKQNTEIIAEIFFLNTRMTDVF